MRRVSLLLLLLVSAVPAARAQVGYTPQTSPYRDLFFRQEISLVAGYMEAGRGSAKVAPGSAPIVGLRYEVRLGGPVAFSLRYQESLGNRNVRDPNRSPATRDRGTTSEPVALIDAGLTVHLTGQRTWHHLTPLVNLGAGIATDYSKIGPDQWTLGTPFAFTFGGGVRYAPGGRYALRVDYGDWLYKVSYPLAFRSPPGGGTSLTTKTGEYLNHNVLTFGVSRFFGR